MVGSQKEFLMNVFNESLELEKPNDTVKWAAAHDNQSQQELPAEGERIIRLGKEMSQSGFNVTVPDPLHWEYPHEIEVISCEDRTRICREIRHQLRSWFIKYTFVNLSTRKIENFD